jgi:hypothetical protein
MIQSNFGHNIKKTMENEIMELFLETEKGLIPLDKEIIEKYNLSVGRKSPFTRYYVVDKTGKHQFNSEKETSSPDLDEMPAGEGAEDDEIVEFTDTGAILSQSEIIDFSHGTDSQEP